MSVMLIMFLISFGLSCLLIYINSFIAKKSTQEREKPSAFECGFDPKSSSRLPFSLRFFLIAVIFLIFDVEITMIIPLPVIMHVSNPVFLILLLMIFILILILGLLHEWNQGALEWK